MSTILFVVPFWRLSSQFAEHQSVWPSRLYGASTVLSVGEEYSRDGIVAELTDEGYRKTEGEVTSGTYRRVDNGILTHLRRFPTPQGMDPGGKIGLAFEGNRLAAITVDGDQRDAVRLPPALLASFYGDEIRERWPVSLDSLPEEVVEAILAAEDHTFFDHGGVSVTGILRAAFVNLREGAVRQGGSTLTQQLVKNLFLSHDRTMVRKLQEAVLAVMVELRYSKKEILETYLNEIYLGTYGGTNLIGIESAARAFFGRSAAELTVDEAAALGGMIRSPAKNSVLKHPENAVERRNWVLARMAKLGWIEPERAKALQAKELGTAPRTLRVRRAEYFENVAVEEAARRFGLETLDDGGYTIFSTLRWSHQQKAKEAVAWGTDALEKGWQKGVTDHGPLQAALVSVDPRDGGILAYVGGRDFQQSQYDRAGQARRQMGSSFKPVVFATAIETGDATPSTLIEDAPLTVRLAGQRWSPQNYDGGYHGWTTARRVLENSFNIATARLALDVGLPEIVGVARRMGISGNLDPVPSLSLGAFEASPLEVATVYATLANGGVRPAIHGLVAIFDAQGNAVPGRALAPPEPVLTPETAYLVTSMLQGVIERGTAAAARRQVKDPLAGKTGTSNDRRDNWFAGYGPAEAAVVWVGYDDNGPTRMSGSRAGVPIWARYMEATRPVAGRADFVRPPGVVSEEIDPLTGELATAYCPQVIDEVFLKGQTPSRYCHLHSGYRYGYGEDAYSERYGYGDSDDGYTGEGYDDGEYADEGEGVGEDGRPRRHPFKRWLKKVFGDG